jgi:hypothetical protein
MAQTYSNTYTGIATTILNGDVDEWLGNIIEVVKQRRQAKAFELAATLRVGDKVRLGGNISPKYLIGLEGVVAGPPSGQRIAVTLGPEAGRYAGTARTPISCVEKIEEAA